MLGISTTKHQGQMGMWTCGKQKMEGSFWKKKNERNQETEAEMLASILVAMRA